MTTSTDISPLTLNRLSVYLRGLRLLQKEGVERISSREMARRFRLSAAQIRKDLAQFGELGIRGVGYEVKTLRGRLEALLGLEKEHRAVIVGAGNIGTALARFPGLNSGSFKVVALVDNDPDRIGEQVGELRIRDAAHLPAIVRREQVEMGILAVPAEAAQENYQALADVGIRAVLNFAPVNVIENPGARVKNVDLLIFLEELAYFLR
ncbi:MAG: redox-sensing transcriptional repressor Rex [Acidobacteriota bacterium]